MLSQEFVLRNPSGLHARPATVLVRTAAGVGAAVHVADLDRGATADARSILEVLALGASAGDRIRVTVDGPDEAAALAALAAVIESGLGEGVANAG